MQSYIVEGLDGEGSFCLVLDLRLASGELPLGDDECEVSFERLTISVYREGFEILNGSKYGEPLKENSVAASKASKSQSQTKSSTSAKIAAAANKIPLVNVSAEKSSLRQNEKSLSTQESYDHLRVKARPNDRWEVSESDREPLDGTYLQQTPLFQALTLPNANRRSLNVSLKVKQRDLSLKQIRRNGESVGRFERITENQRRLIDVFIAKSLSNAVYGNRKYMGEIILSMFEYSDES